MNTYRFKIENYHSISKADIAINGITVLAGVNGSGKSTLARWLFYIVKGANEYEKNCLNEIKQNILELLMRYEKIQKHISFDSNFLSSFSKAKQLISNANYSYSDILEIFTSITNETREALRKYFDTTNNNEKRRILSYLQISIKDDETDDELLSKLVTTHLQQAEENLNLYESLKKERPTAIFFKNIQRFFNEYEKPQNIIFQEDGVDIIDNKRIGTLFGLKSAFYIDTPMAVNVTKSDNPFWNEFRKLLNNKNEVLDNDDIQQLLDNLRNITGGAVIDKEDFLGEKELYFTRKSDNLTVKLEQMATGVKSFAYLDRLLGNGYLNKDSILILDEPEAHLHPQWIVEYARLLVQIHKETGLYIMLASHDPDMVSAIRYISEKEGVLGDTTFYLAEQDDNAETFSYKELGTDIEPIFASFNKSFDLIEKYGVDNGI